MAMNKLTDIKAFKMPMPKGIRRIAAAAGQNALASVTKIKKKAEENAASSKILFFISQISEFSDIKTKYRHQYVSNDIKLECFLVFSGLISIGYKSQVLIY